MHHAEAEDESRAGPAGSAHLRHLVGAMHEVPALVRDRHLDVLAANPLARRLSAAFEPGVNIARFTFLNPIVRLSIPGWTELTRVVAASLRTSLEENLEDAGFRTLVGELAARSDAFNRAWAAEPPDRRGSGDVGFDHPVVGPLALTYQELLVVGAAPGLVLTVWCPADDATADRLRQLAGPVGTA